MKDTRMLTMVFVALSVISLSVAAIAPAALAQEPKQTEGSPMCEGEQCMFRQQTYQKGSECDFRVINFMIAPPYDPRQVPALMGFDKGLCDPVKPIDLSEGCPPWVIDEAWGNLCKKDI